MDSQREIFYCNNPMRRIENKLYIIFKINSYFIERAVNTLSVSRYMERIADLSTNIAQDVVFMVEGESIRHQK